MSKVPKHELEIILRKLSDLEESVAEIKDKVRGLLEGSNINQTVVASPKTPKSPSAFNLPSPNDKFTKVYGNKSVIGSVGSKINAPTQVQSGYGKKPSGIVGARLSAFESTSDKGASPRPPPPPIPSATFRKVSVKPQNNVGSSPVASSPVNNSSTVAVAASISGSGEKSKLPHISVAMKNEILQRTTTANATTGSSDSQVPKQFQQRVNDSDSEEAEKNANDDDWDD